MGGPGSGRPGARPVAEESCPFPIGAIVAALKTARSGRFSGSYRLTWSWRGGRVAAALTYRVTLMDAGQLLVTLAYQIHGEAIRDPIAVTTTQLHHGGVRSWWCCPGCDRRVGVLYLPSGGRRWRCRHCWSITYQSSNDSHAFDAIWRQLGARPPRRRR